MNKTNLKFINEISSINLNSQAFHNNKSIQVCGVPIFFSSGCLVFVFYEINFIFFSNANELRIIVWFVWFHSKVDVIPLYIEFKSIDCFSINLRFESNHKTCAELLWIHSFWDSTNRYVDDYSYCRNQLISSDSSEFRLVILTILGDECHTLCTTIQIKGYFTAVTAAPNWWLMQLHICAKYQVCSF